MAAAAESFGIAMQGRHQRPDRDARHRQGFLGIETRKREQVLDDLGHASRLAAQFADDRFELGDLLGFDQVQIAVHHSQWRAQLVRYVGDEIAAHLFHPQQLADVAHQQQGMPFRIGNQAQAQMQVGILRRGDVGQRIDATAFDPGLEARDGHGIDQALVEIARVVDAEHAAGGRVEPADPVVRVDRDQCIRQGHGGIPERAQESEQLGPAECGAPFHTFDEKR